MSDCQWDRKVKARKVHVCDECRMGIPKGTLHHVQSGIQEGHPYRWRVHSDCAEMYWEVNKDNFQSWFAAPLLDYGVADLEYLRGKYPHVICRMELRDQLSELRKDQPHD